MEGLNDEMAWPVCRTRPPFGKGGVGANTCHAILRERLFGVSSFFFLAGREGGPTSPSAAQG